MVWYGMLWRAMVWHAMVWHAMACYGLAPTILRPLLARLSTMATLGRRAGQCSEDKRGKISQGDEGTRSGNFLEEEEGVEGEGGNFNALSCLEEGGGPEGVGVSVEVVEVVSPET